MRDELVNKLTEVSVGWWEAHVARKFRNADGVWWEFLGKKRITGNWVFTIFLTSTAACLRGDNDCSKRLLFSTVKAKIESNYDSFATRWKIRLHPRRTRGNSFDPRYPIDYAVSSQKASEHESSQFSKPSRTNIRKRKLFFKHFNGTEIFCKHSQQWKEENLGTKRR